MRKLCIAIGVIFTVLVVINSQTTAQEEIYGCVSNKDGKLRIVSDPSECNIKKETSISWNAVGPQGEQGLQGEPGEPGPAGQGCIKVYDSSDPPQYLGILLGTWYGIIDEIFMPNEKVRIKIDTRTGNARKYCEIYFESDNCQGTPYGNGSDLISLHGERLFLTSNSVLTGLTMGSLLDESGECNEWTGLKEYLFQAIEIFADDMPFTLPVTLPLRYESE